MTDKPVTKGKNSEYMYTTGNNTSNTVDNVAQQAFNEVNTAFIENTIKTTDIGLLRRSLVASSITDQSSQNNSQGPGSQSTDINSNNNQPNNNSNKLNALMGPGVNPDSKKEKSS